MNSPSSPAVSNENHAEDEISLLDLLLVIAKHKKKIIGLPLAVGLVAAVISLAQPNEYTASLKIAPSKNAPTYNWVLGNEQVRLQVTKEMKLSEHFEARGRQDTLREMAEVLKVTLNAKDGYLDVNVTDTDPEFAAKLANRMGLALQTNLYEMRLLDVSKQCFELESRRELAQKNKLKFDQITKQAELADTIKQLRPADRFGVASLAAIQAESRLQGGVYDMMQNELVRMQDQLASL